ncbi:AMP-binding enzyme [Bradyrhizobium jicamae]|uniref:AMP-binding enzyme n=1 Tax=Bradyrhizobium jicamae TaxID=280332 RepID=UPI0007C819F3|nr:thioesterase domain-containing protein [Bradyrhizobium jicamae]
MRDGTEAEAKFTFGPNRPGTVGSLDGDGFPALHGRRSEVINRGGEKIAPAEVESALLRHPAVAEAAAFAIPHPRLGDDVAAAVIPHSGAQTTPAELRQFLQRELASFKIPRHILFLDRLPKGATGKVQRRRLREALDVDHRATKPLPAVKKATLDLEAELLILWRRLLKSGTVTIDDDFFARGGDSLLAMEMLIEVERLIGQPVPETILFGAETIRQLAPKIAMQTGAQATPFFEFSAGGHRRPLYFFNGDILSGHEGMRRMVELFGADYPIISIDPHGLRGEPVPPSIEAMAADRLPHILERQTSGPFLLGGKCNGAMVAFEAARLLMAAGHRVDLVAMVDPPTVAARPASRAIIGLMKPIASPHLLRWMYEQMARLERYANAWRHERNVIVEGKFLPALWDAYSIAMAQYLPAPLDVPVTFYAAEHDGRAWRHLSSHVEVLQVPGGHSGCLTIGADLLVDHLRQRIDVHRSGERAVPAPCS